MGNSPNSPDTSKLVSYMETYFVANFGNISPKYDAIVVIMAFVLLNEYSFSKLMKIHP